MKIFFLRLLCIFFLVFFEFSFFDVLFPGVSAPLIIIASIIAWALLSSFPQVFFMTIPLTILFDIVSSGRPGVLTLYGVCLVYLVSFLSRRLLLEHRGMGMTLYALFTALSALGFTIFGFVFSQGNIFLWTKETLSAFVLFLPSQNLFLSMFISLLLFPPIYFVIRWFEGYVRYIAQGEILKMRR